MLVLGADAIRKMDFWFRPRAVPSLCNVCILNRAGERVDIPSVLAEMNEILMAVYWTIYLVVT